MPHSLYNCRCNIIYHPGCAGQVNYQYNCTKAIHVERSCCRVIQDTRKKQPCLLLREMLSAPAMDELQAL